MKRSIAAIIMAIVAIATTSITALTTQATLEHREYPTALIVSYVDYEEDVVYACTWTNIEYSWYRVEDWMEGDIAACIMDDNGTPDTIFDDQIVAVRYAGWVF